MNKFCSSTATSTTPIKQIHPPFSPYPSRLLPLNKQSKCIFKFVMYSGQVPPSSHHHHSSSQFFQHLQQLGWNEYHHSAPHMQAKESCYYKAIAMPFIYAHRKLRNENTPHPQQHLKVQQQLSKFFLCNLISSTHLSCGRIIRYSEKFSCQLLLTHQLRDQLLTYCAPM